MLWKKLWPWDNSYKVLPKKWPTKTKLTEDDNLHLHFHDKIRGSSKLTEKDHHSSRIWRCQCIFQSWTLIRKMCSRNTKTFVQHWSKRCDWVTKQKNSLFKQKHCSVNNNHSNGHSLTVKILQISVASIIYIHKCIFSLHESANSNCSLSRPQSWRYHSFEIPQLQSLHTLHTRLMQKVPHICFRNPVQNWHQTKRLVLSINHKIKTGMDKIR